ncbi:MAG: PD-(D/E)XK nuclease family protein [Deltaproteobacteria bacterium]|nr:PD-(D/E)XK nuclease family protein [Deltaproteobacteria bacterium]
MPITLLHGPAGGGKTNFLLRRIFGKYGPDSYADAFFLVVPTARSADIYRKKLLQADLFQKIFIGHEVVSFGQFLFNILKQNLPRLHRATSRMNRNIVRKLLFQDKYPSFKGGSAFAGIVDELAETLVRFKKNGLSPLSARRYLTAHMTPELDDLLKLFEDTDNLSREMHYYNEGDFYAETLKLLRTNRLKLPESHQVARLKGIYIDRLFPLTLGQREILKELDRLFPHLDIVVSYSFDYQAGEDPHFYPAYSFLGEIARENEYFHGAKKERKTALHSFTDPAEEIFWVANRVEEQLGNGIPASRIGIVLPPDPFYHRRLADSLTKNLIPFFPSYTPSLSHFLPLANRSAHDIAKTFLEMPEASPSLSALAQMEEFDREWEFEKNLVFGADTPADTLEKWRRDELSRLRLEPLPATGGVALLTTEEALAGDFDVLFVLGYVERYYPPPASEHPFYPVEALIDPVLREVLEGPAYRHRMEKYRLEQAVDRTAKEVIFTRPKILWDGKEQAASNLLTVEGDSSGLPLAVSPPAIPPLAAIFPKLRKNQFSVSEIETYQTCPYQYYARYHLKLGRLKEEEIDVPPDVRGNFLHRVLQKLYSGKRDLFRDAIEYDLYLNRLIDEARTLINEEKKTDAFLSRAPEAVREPFCGRVGTAIAAFLRDETALIRQKQKKTLPAWFEWGFGSGGVPPLRLKHGEILLTGRIDRIDVDPRQKTFSVIDYKSGEADTTAGILSGESVQIPVYLMAVQKNLLKDHHPSGGFLVNFKEGKTAGLCIVGRGDEAILKKNAQITEAEWQTLQETVTSRIAEIVRRINEGEFTPRPLSPSDCRFCDYRDVCHYERKEKEEE